MPAPSPAPVACPLCEGSTSLTADVPGYQLPARFPIRECSRCAVSFAWPLAVPTGLYDRLYGLPETERDRLRAYDGYATIASAISDHERPLDFLAAEGPRYWGVRRALEETPRGSRILEVGCGLGYLTYALTRAGYDATGLDISERAIAEAKQRFGPGFRRADVEDLVREESGSYDAIVLTELLEHVPDPMGLLGALVPLLAASGRILLTTPNKSAHPPGTLWQTDLPPVHLWWFSEPSLRVLAERLDLGVRFVDYSGDTRGHGRSLRVKWPGREVFMAPQLDAEGEVLPGPPPSELRRYFPDERLGLRQLALWARYKLNPSRRRKLTTRRATLCAVLERPV